MRCDAPCFGEMEPFTRFSECGQYSDKEWECTKCGRQSDE